MEKQVDQFQPKIEVLVGAELSAYGVGKYSVSEEDNQRIKFRLYLTNHYHLDYWEHPNSKNPQAYAEHLLENTRALIISNRAHCIAHPFTGFYVRDNLHNFAMVSQAITENERADTLRLGTENSIVWELNKKMSLIEPKFFAKIPEHRKRVRRKIFYWHGRASAF